MEKNYNKSSNKTTRTDFYLGIEEQDALQTDFSKLSEQDKKFYLLGVGSEIQKHIGGIDEVSKRLIREMIDKNVKQEIKSASANLPKVKLDKEEFTEALKLIDLIANALREFPPEYVIEHRKELFAEAMKNNAGDEEKLDQIDYLYKNIYGK